MHRSNRQRWYVGESDVPMTLGCVGERIDVCAGSGVDASRRSRARFRNRLVSIMTAAKAYEGKRAHCGGHRTIPFETGTRVANARKSRVGLRRHVRERLAVFALDGPVPLALVERARLRTFRCRFGYRGVGQFPRALNRRFVAR